MNKHKIYSGISLCILYSTTILWLSVYNTFVELFVDFGVKEPILLVYQDYRYFILIPTLFITALIAYFYIQKKRLYTISTIFIAIQIIFMIWFLYKDTFMLSSVSG